AYSIGIAAHAEPGSVLVFYGAGVPVYLEPLHKRVVECDDVGGDVAVVGLDVPDLQPLVVEAVELHAEITTHVFDRKVHHRRHVRPTYRAHARSHATLLHVRTDHP